MSTQVNTENGLNQYLSLHQNALTLLGYRQTVLASNIANADTPHYKARDFDFASILRSNMPDRAQQPMSGASLSATNPQHLLANSLEAALPRLLYRQEQQGGIDGNTVDVDVERIQFAQNAVMYETTLTLLNGRLRGLLSVIQS